MPTATATRLSDASRRRAEVTELVMKPDPSGGPTDLTFVSSPEIYASIFESLRAYQMGLSFDGLW